MNTVAYWKRQPQSTKDAAAGAVLAVASLLGLLYVMGLLRISFPELHPVRGARLVVALIVGLGMIAGGFLMLYVSFRHTSAKPAVLALVFFLFGISLVGVNVDAPPLVQSIIDLANNVIRLLNRAIKALPGV